MDQIRHSLLTVIALCTLFASLVANAEEATAQAEASPSQTEAVNSSPNETPDNSGSSDPEPQPEATEEAIAEETTVKPATDQPSTEPAQAPKAEQIAEQPQVQPAPDHSPASTVPVQPIAPVVPVAPPAKKQVAKQPAKPVAPEGPSLIDVIQLEDHASNEKYQEGYALAQKILPHWEGDSTFDFLYGVHAIETGHFDEATFAFERLTLLNPRTIRYRLELARALYFNNNLDTAKNEFEIALASNPPENVKTNIQGFLDKIKKAKEKASHHWSVGAGFNMGFDSNINSGTEEDGVDIPNIGFVSLQEEAQSQSSSFTQFSTQGIYSYSHWKHHSLDVSFNTTHKRNDEVSTYDLDVINLFAGYSWQPTQNIRLQGGLSNTDVKLDGEAYQNQNTVNAMGLYTNKSGFSFSASMSSGSRSAESINAPDADISLFALSMIWPSSKNKSTNLSLYTSNDDVSNTDLAHFGKTASGINFGTKLLITPSIVRSMLISISSTEYQAADPNFQEVRKDTSAMGSWGYEWSVSKYFNLNANLIVSHNASNLDLFTNYRAIVNTGISVNF